jgi:hypothetical protein
MSEDCRKSLIDSTTLIRAIRERDVNKDTRKIRKGAFIPRRSGKDDDGLSVSQPAGQSRSQLARRIQSQEERYCTLTAGEIRAISVDAVTLEACPAPTERDPFHALIKNVPTTLEETAMATRFAQRLAEVSAEYTHSRLVSRL